jgi:hypothetical protein
MLCWPDDGPWGDSVRDAAEAEGVLSTLWRIALIMREACCASFADGQPSDQASVAFLRIATCRSPSMLDLQHSISERAYIGREDN